MTSVKERKGERVGGGKQRKKIEEANRDREKGKAERD